jgi:hypothetical protein
MVVEFDSLRLADNSATGYWHRLEALGVRGSAAIHVAQLCLWWIEPQEASVAEYVAFLRQEAESSHGLGAVALEQQVASVYLEAASELDRLRAR